ncbi:MAG: hypothetical protein L0271_16805 [Gemmatimonadetes bacterium]|nr:hypothetical protein [Gemmatimonadota bacterium]
MKPLLLACALIVMTHGTGTAQTDDLRCAYSHRFTCTSEGCQPTSVEHGYLRVPPLASLRQALADSARIRIQRCDDRDCVPLDIERATSEGFITLSARDGAFLLKIFAQPDSRELGLRTGDFTEVVTSMMMTWVGYGQCTVPFPRWP